VLFHYKPRHRQFRRQITLQCILIGLSRRFPWIGCRSFLFIFRDKKRRKLPVCRLEKLEMRDAQTNHLGQVVQIFFWNRAFFMTNLADIVNFGAKLPYNVF
jgi:hypothetical protein